MSEVGYVYLAPSGEQIGTLSDDGFTLDPDDEMYSADDPPSYFDGDITMTAIIKDMDEDLLRRFFGWTIMVVENPDTHTKVFHRVYTLDYKKGLQDDEYEVIARKPVLIIPPGIPDERSIISKWLEMDEVPGEDYAYVTADEPDVIRVTSILDMSCVAGMFWLVNDL